MFIGAQEAAHRAASDAECIVWVDERDQVLGSLPRAELRARGLIGRAAFILLFNPAGEICVHRRTLSKAVYPGCWDMAAGGMLGAGESYWQCARRELEEELGIADAELKDHGRFFFDAPHNRIWSAVFSACSDQPLHVQPEEVLEAGFIPLAQLLRDIQHKPFCPDSLVALRLYLTSTGQ